jgi:hypothetical protein
MVDLRSSSHSVALFWDPAGGLGALKYRELALHFHPTTLLSCCDMACTDDTTRETISALKRRINALQEENSELHGILKSLTK